MKKYFLVRVFKKSLTQTLVECFKRPKKSRIREKKMKLKVSVAAFTCNEKKDTENINKMRDLLV